MHIDDAAVDQTIGRLAQQDLVGLGLRAALGEIMNAMPDLFSVDGAGILLLDEQQVLRYVASTDSGAQVLESVQEATGRGPCVASIVDDVIVEVDDIVEDDRWPELAAVLVPNGIRGVLGAPVHLAGATIGSLNVYHRDPYGWDYSDRAALSAFDRLAERLIAAAVLAERHEALVDQLEHALHARVVIDRAVGVLIAVENLDAAAAFERIRRAARSTRRSAREVAADIIVARKLL